MATDPADLDPVPLARAAFDEKRAACALCGSRVRLVGEMTQVLVRRLIGPEATAGECPVCKRLTFFALS